MLDSDHLQKNYVIPLKIMKINLANMTFGYPRGAVRYYPTLEVREVGSVRGNKIQPDSTGPSIFGKLRSA